MTQFRSLLKKVVDDKIEAFYLVGPTHSNVEERLKAWLVDRRYLFDGDPLKVCLWLSLIPAC